ncbi:Ino80, NuA4 and Swr1 complex actin-like protein Arp4 [Schizosaccharomyces pombe]|uniref:Actin-related protein 4 n=1 Tax=Schizosaccharomyces pombe (strain 972 / ATCC 24843) TaxID=284812 RepID=ARP4_SCHPO|nr:actin-like protein Arp4 [Schizosaccharomyces pombe]Q9P7X7.1 RecName: Full=Actin-related protein 4; AltName: Full=Actin-like protein arp4; Short=Actin-like protein 4; AltName: Full=Altered polarity protein 5 [Schizosaccharomyces pombe 972h-]CAB66436.1 actin-like protein Arp4 [Schizosaccharomyces pombe]|eukprot:NP_595820.1 actin-like protein Arp4 [Schizosaccharomyces pombe]
MTSAFYGGDEVSAIVIDPGSKWTRIGFSGEDIPKCVLPSYCGEFSDGRRLFGEEYIYKSNPGMEIKNAIRNGWVENWDVTVDLWRYGLEQQLKTNPLEHPILITEPFDNPPENRVKTLETMFESLRCPATYLAKQETCAAFASGKGTACLVDIGAERSSVSAIYDGFVLQKGYQVQHFSGNAINDILAQTLRDKNFEVMPKYLVKSKNPVEIGQPANCELRPRDTTDSYHQFQVQRVYDEWKEECALISDVPFSSETTIAESEFEFPDGSRMMFGAERYQIPEHLFVPGSDEEMNEEPSKPIEQTENNEVSQQDSSVTNTSSRILGIPQLFQNCISECDVDIRASLLNNVIVCGGTSLMQGFSLRLQNELSKLYPGSRLKIHASGHVVERSYASWLGGSILSSLGTFHQLWISRQEYEEHGSDRLALIEKRCK